MGALAIPAAFGLSSAVTTGLVYGALIGGVTAAIKGENVLKGALLGGGLGAITGGISGGFLEGAAPAVQGVTAGVTQSTQAAIPQALGGPLATPEFNMVTYGANQAAQQAAQPAATSFLSSLGQQGQAELIKQGGAMLTGLMSPEQKSEAESALEIKKLDIESKKATPAQGVQPITIRSLTKTPSEPIPTQTPTQAGNSFIDFTRESYKRIPGVANA